MTTISKSQSLTSESIKDCTLRVPNNTTTLFLVWAIIKAIFTSLGVSRHPGRSRTLPCWASHRIHAQYCIAMIAFCPFFFQSIKSRKSRAMRKDENFSSRIYHWGIVRNCTRKHLYIHVYAYVCEYIYTCMYTYMLIYVHIYFIYMCMYMYVYIRVYIYI